MGLSKPVITTEADISGITSVLSEIKANTQTAVDNTAELAGGVMASDAPVIGVQTAYGTSNGMSSFTKLLSGTGKGKLHYSVQANQQGFSDFALIYIDGVKVFETPYGTSSPAGLTAFPESASTYYESDFTFSESFEIQYKNTSGYTHYHKAMAYFQ